MAPGRVVLCCCHNAYPTTSTPPRRRTTKPSRSFGCGFVPNRPTRITTSTRSSNTTPTKAVQNYEAEYTASHTPQAHVQNATASAPFPSQVEPQQGFHYQNSQGQAFEAASGGHHNGVSSRDVVALDFRSWADTLAIGPLKDRLEKVRPAVEASACEARQSSSELHTNRPTDDASHRRSARRRT